MDEKKEVRRGDIYLCRLKSKGSEQSGFRPVLVLQNDILNSSSTTTIIAPISTKKKTLKTHVCIKHQNLDRESVVLLEQIRVVDKSRLLYYLGRIDSEAFMDFINKKIKFVLDML